MKGASHLPTKCLSRCCWCPPACLHQMVLTGCCVAVSAGVWPAVKRVSHLPSEYLPPAATLFLGACAWAWIHPASFHILQCLAASVPVSAGYAQTARASATGRLAKGKSLHAAAH